MGKFLKLAFVVLAIILNFSLILDAYSAENIFEKFFGKAEEKIDPFKNPKKSQEFLEETARNILSLDYWRDNFLQIIVFFIGPLLFVFLLLLAILNEIGIFTKTIRFFLALLMAVISIPSTVLSALMANVVSAGIYAVLGFLGAIVLLALSNVYRKKIMNYEYFMGSHIFTIWIAHLPLMAAFTFIGFILGNIIDLNLDIKQTLWIWAAFASIYIIAVLIFESLRSFWKYHVLIIGLLAALSLILIFFFQINPIFMLMGFLVGNFVAFLEWGRKMSIIEIAREVNRRVASIKGEIKKLENEKEALRNRMERGENGSLAARIRHLEEIIETLELRANEELRKAKEKELKQIFEQ